MKFKSIYIGLACFSLLNCVSDDATTAHNEGVANQCALLNATVDSPSTIAHLGKSELGMYLFRVSGDGSVDQEFAFYGTPGEFSKYPLTGSGGSGGAVEFEFEVDTASNTATYSTSCCSESPSEFISYVHTNGSVADSLTPVDITAEQLGSLGFDCPELLGLE